VFVSLAGRGCVVGCGAWCVVESLAVAFVVSFSMCRWCLACGIWLVRSISRSGFESGKKNLRKLCQRAGSIDQSIGLRIGPKKQKEAVPEGWFG